MATVQDWVDAISRDITEPLDGVVARHVRFAIQEFFRESESWRVKETLTLAVGDSRFPLLDVPNDCYPVTLDWAYVTPVAGSRARLEHTLEERIDVSDSGDARCVALDTDNFEVALDTEGTAGVLEVRYIVQPSRDIGEVPDLVADKWFNGIKHGAMAYLLSVPDKAWTDPHASSNYMMMFRESVAKAKREARRDRSRPRRVARFNRGFSW